MFPILCCVWCGGVCAGVQAHIMGFVSQVTGSTMWQQRLTFRIKLRDIPVATRVIFNVATKDGPVGWAGLNLFTYQRQLKSGAVVLKMWPGECTAEMVKYRSVTRCV